MLLIKSLYIAAGSAAAGMLQKTEAEKVNRQGGPALLDKIRAASEARAKLKAALQREKESNEALCLRTAGIARKLQAGATKQEVIQLQKGISALFFAHQ